MILFYSELLTSSSSPPADASGWEEDDLNSEASPLRWSEKTDYLSYMIFTGAGGRPNVMTGT